MGRNERKERGLVVLSNQSTHGDGGIGDRVADPPNGFRGPDTERVPILDDLIHSKSGDALGDLPLPNRLGTGVVGEARVKRLATLFEEHDVFSSLDVLETGVIELSFECGLLGAGFGGETRDEKEGEKGHGDENSAKNIALSHLFVHEVHYFISTRKTVYD